MKEIIQVGDERLLKMSQEVADTKAPEVQQLLRDLDEALASQADGVAISAPQIGVNLRVFVVAGKVFDDAYMSGDTDEPNPAYKNLYVINPVFTKYSKDKVIEEEGCLSIRGVYGDVERHKNVTIEAIDANGEKFTRGAGGLLSRIFQHETDHLDGILFTEKAVTLRYDDDYKNNPDHKHEGL